MLMKNYFAVSYLFLEFDSNETAKITLQDGTTLAVNVSQLTSYGSRPWKAMNNFTLSQAASSGNEGVRVGTGTTKPTQKDYNLENMITSGISVTEPSDIVRNVTDTYEEYSATFGVTCTSTTAVTISEIGLFAYHMAGASGSYNYYMVDRTVLETPIVINPGEAKQLTYSIRFNYPTE